MHKILQKLTFATGLLLLLIMLQSVGCKKDSDYRTKYYGDYRFSIHKDARIMGGTHIDTTYIKNGKINEGISSHTIAIAWDENWQGNNGSLVELHEDGTFSDDKCTGEFTDINTVRFTARWYNTASSITYNVTGTRN